MLSPFTFFTFLVPDRRLIEASLLFLLMISGMPAYDFSRIRPMGELKFVCGLPPSKEREIEYWNKTIPVLPINHWDFFMF
jgi:hypothetical protein